jgi:group I intron endonuclease
MDSILDDPVSIKGIIYLIEHTASGKQYVGQTLSHRKNHERYRPFGAVGRFRDHISEALNNTKRKQCTYLNNAIRLHGADAFTVRVLEVCERALLDTRESHYISEYSSLYPTGYNLTTGGKGMRAMTTIINTTPLNPPRQRGGCESRSPETRQKMSDRAQKHGFTPEERRVRMENAQALHAAKRAQRFKGVRIDPGVVDDYISIRKGRVTVDVDGCTASFIGKYESEEALKQKAREFLVNLAQATLPNCSGNP